MTHLSPSIFYHSLHPSEGQERVVYFMCSFFSEKPSLSTENGFQGVWITNAAWSMQSHKLCDACIYFSHLDHHPHTGVVSFVTTQDYPGAMHMWSMYASADTQSHSNGNSYHNRYTRRSEKDMDMISRSSCISTLSFRGSARWAEEWEEGVRLRYPIWWNQTFSGLTSSDQLRKESWCSTICLIKYTSVHHIITLEKHLFTHFFTLHHCHIFV